MPKSMPRLRRNRNPHRPRKTGKLFTSTILVERSEAFGPKRFLLLRSSRRYQSNLPRSGRSRCREDRRTCVGAKATRSTKRPQKRKPRLVPGLRLFVIRSLMPLGPIVVRQIVGLAAPSPRISNGPRSDLGSQSYADWRPHPAKEKPEPSHQDIPVANDFHKNSATPKKLRPDRKPVAHISVLSTFSWPVPKPLVG